MSLACVRNWMNWVGIVMILPVLQACVVAPPVEREPIANRPFVVDHSAVSPAAASIIYLTHTTPKDFSIEDATFDPDGDNLFRYWYLYPADSDTWRDVGLSSSYTFDPCHAAPGSMAVNAPSEWMLEVVVSDRRRRFDPASQYDFPDGEPLDGAADSEDSDEIANWETVAWWRIVVQSGEACP